MTVDAKGGMAVILGGLATKSGMAGMLGGRQVRVSDSAFALSQCEQTFENKGCTTIGVCGKTPTMAGLQDLLIYSLKGLGSWAHLARQNGLPVDFEISSFINNAIFSTLTNGKFI